MADRRLSSPGREPRDDARKLLHLDAKDGAAFLAYAGLGATAAGTEPSEWMARVLRGRSLLLEQYLVVLANAASRELPRNLVRLPIRAHTIIVCAILRNEPRVYTIDLFVSEGGETFYRCTRHVAPDRKGVPRVTPRIAMGGSGAMPLFSDRRNLTRELVRLVNAYERGRVSPETVADHLAMLNYRAYELMLQRDRSVSPTCIVVWRGRTGGHRFYSGTTCVESDGGFPTIANGMDVRAILEATGPMTREHMLAAWDAMERGETAPELDVDRMNAELAMLPSEPDERLD